MAIETIEDFRTMLAELEYDRALSREIARKDPVARFNYMGRHIRKRSRKLRRQLIAVSNRIARFQTTLKDTPAS